MEEQQHNVSSPRNLARPSHYAELLGPSPLGYTLPMPATKFRCPPFKKAPRFVPSPSSLQHTKQALYLVEDGSFLGHVKGTLFCEVSKDAQVTRGLVTSSRRLTKIAGLALLLYLHYTMLKGGGGGSSGEGTREPWGTLGKLREYKGIMGLLGYLPPLDHPPLRTSYLQVPPRGSAARKDPRRDGFGVYKFKGTRPSNKKLSGRTKCGVSIHWGVSF